MMEQAAVTEAAFVDAARSARSFAILMRDNNGAKEIFSRLFASFKGLTVNDVERHARDIHSWLVGAPDPVQLAGQVDGLGAPFPNAQEPLEQARMRVLDIVRQVRLQEQIDLPNDTAVLLLRIALMMYNRVFREQHPGPVHRIPLLVDREAFNADPIALECAKYILTGDTTGTIFHRQPSSPPVNPKDDIRARALANLQVSTLMKAVMSSFDATTKAHVFQAVSVLRDALTRIPGVPPVNLNLPLGDPQEAKESSIVQVAVEEISKTIDMKFTLMQACAALGDAVAGLVAKKYRISIWNTERARLDSEKQRYIERIGTLRKVMTTVDAYRTVFKSYESRLEALVLAVEPVAKTTDAAVLVSRRASGALTAFINATAPGRRPDADRVAHDPPGLGAFGVRIPTSYEEKGGQIVMSNWNPENAIGGQVVETAYNRLVYFGVLMVCVIGKDAELLQAVGREQMHLQSRVAKLTQRIPDQINMNTVAEEALVREKENLVTQSTTTILNHGRGNAIQVPVAQFVPSAAAVTDILALSSLFPVSQNDTIDHLVAFVLGESNVVSQAVLIQKFTQLGLQTVADRDDFAVGSLETASDFLAALTPRTQDPAKSTILADSVLAKRVTDDVVKRIAPRIQASMTGAFGEQREALAKSIVATNEARRKYEKRIEDMSGKQRVFLNSAYGEQNPLDKLDESSIAAVNDDFKDECERLARVVYHIPGQDRYIRGTQAAFLKRCIAQFHEGDNPHEDLVRDVPWATPLLDVFRNHDQGGQDNQDTAFMMLFVIEQTIDRLETRWQMWKATADQVNQPIDDAIQRLRMNFDRIKVSQWRVNEGDQERYNTWASFIRALPVSRPDDFKALDDRSAELLKEKTRLLAENERLKRQLEDEKKSMRERARDDLAKIDLQRQRDSDAFDNRISEMKLKMMMADKKGAASSSSSRDKDRERDKDKDKLRVNGRTGVPMTGQAYVLNALGSQESTAARVMDMAMDPVGLRLPMGFMHPFETQFRPGYRKGFNPLFWYQLLREFVRTVATTANLAADRCLVDAMPDASLVQYAAFYEPQGYNEANDQFTKDFRTTAANQLYMAGRTEGKEKFHRQLITDMAISPFIREKITQKFKHVDDFLSTDKVRAVRAKLDFLKAREARGGVDPVLASRESAQPPIVQMGIGREMKYPENKYFEENINRDRTRTWSPPVVDRALAIDANARGYEILDLGDFVPGYNILREKTTSFIDDEYNRVLVPQLNGLTNLYTFHIPVIILSGETHSPRVALVQYQWECVFGDLPFERLSRVYYALRRCADESDATGVIVLAQQQQAFRLEPGALFVGSKKTQDKFIDKTSSAFRKQLARSLTRDPSAKLMDLIVRDLGDSLPPAPQGAQAAHGQFVVQADQAAPDAVVLPDAKNNVAADEKNIDDFLAQYNVSHEDNIFIGDRDLQDMSIEELEAYQKDHLELADHVRELAGQEAKFIVEMKRLSRVHAGNMENVLGEYLAPEPPLSGIKQALHYARQLFRKTKKESPLLLAEFLVSSVANDDFAALVVAYIRKNNAMANNVVATKQLVADTNQMLGLAQGSMMKLGYMPKLTPFQNVPQNEDPFIDGRAYSDYYYFQHEREDFQEADSFTRRF